MPFATFIAARSDASPAMYVVAVAVYGAGSIICHQLPGRSFHVGSAQMPVCARCTGIYAGAAMAAALPTVATLLFEWSTGSTPSNTVRALAGFPLGAAVAWVIGSSL